MSDGVTAVVLPAWAADDLMLPQELFVIPDGDGFLIYSPLALGVASVNAAGGAAVERVRRGEERLADLDPDFLQSLMDANVVVPRRDAPRRPTRAERGGFDPSGLTLFLTTKCTLACTYCYASANDRPSMMSWDTAKAAIDWMVRHASARGRDRIDLMFHGGGEVTVAFELMKRAVAYARVEGAARGIAVGTSAGLNGVMTGPVLEWVMANVDNATVSFDGLPEIHNAQRPLVTGRDSFDIIAAALRRMDEAGYQYGLRVTVTRAGLPRMAESVAFICREFKTPHIQLEPVAGSGRARENDLTTPDPHEFVTQFRRARTVARRHGRELKYSGARFGTVTNAFCQVSDDLLAVTPEGWLSSCYEVGQTDDPRAGTFLYGRLNAERGDLDLDMTKVIRLRTLTVEHKKPCDTCYCRWSCGGECSAKLALAGDAWDTSGNPRCTINRALTLDQMKEYLERGGGYPAPQRGASPY